MGTDRIELAGDGARLLGDRRRSRGDGNEVFTSRLADLLRADVEPIDAHPGGHGGR